MTENQNSQHLFGDLDLDVVWDFGFHAQDFKE